MAEPVSLACEGWGGACGLWSVVLELASLIRRAGHGADRCERAIAAPIDYKSGYPHRCGGVTYRYTYTRVKGKWTTTSNKIVHICTIFVPSLKKRSQLRILSYAGISSREPHYESSQTNFNATIPIIISTYIMHAKIEMVFQKVTKKVKI